MDQELLLPLIGGAVLVLIVVVGTVLVVFGPSDTPPSKR
jgi:Sec-independent protein translocase protein TatA